ncbi:hypothetical protein BP1258A_0857 [Burkholderia pseudomallei 1258a]|uniref:Uncharacterized protein n=1 Tax=Burkholderia pseudomallei (strain 1026b) TaxID=884204 RepID=A0A0H3HID3_BURP2|nr:hypothetical protein BP1026B_I1021 [Burkholderia pseudomallei 1026b]EIF67032.1 hypothetical protein BP1026A_0480 [Burkholderia pseudomallei 1026a]EIF67893.1 hypothetical protein BP1258A_0857 [Burkholderia pseudomallei 1258a]EIF69635.1 hypothetical protein BP1258B_0951 [Burkholderia pseudomallei 1258b]EIF77555.1 hypothetical protein BP354E_0756 [Burkholderia pseudomallei 354e]EIF81864.1 hypothetical protein BP354A_0943 [Burkholderia pseudomallei 354a]KGC39522.1 hypothetical protein DO73_442
MGFKRMRQILFQIFVTRAAAPPPIELVRTTQRHARARSSGE